MRATIVKTNNRDMFFFERNDGETGVLEYIDGAFIEEGVVLVGDFSSDGTRNVSREDNGKKVTICIEDFCDWRTARRILFGEE